MTHDADTQTLGQLTVKDLDGAEVKFGTAWAEKPAVMVWVRHYGCLLCREHARDFQPHQDELKKLGVNLVFVGMGFPAMAQDFKEQMHLEAPVWTDHDRKTYKALGLKRGWRTVVNRRSVISAVRAMVKGNFQGRTQGPPGQQGGVLVVKKGGEPVYVYASEVAGDHPPMSEVLAAARVAAT